MNAPDSDEYRLYAEYMRLVQVDSVLVDIGGAAWASMEHKDFADSATEFAKLEQVKPARTSVDEEASGVWSRYLEAAYGKASADEIRADARTESERPSRRIERSR
ncbi:hypothetical protein NONI108955_34375 [Nocardia ninae]|uniref:Uncharacterized protein n=1 Tax=Nocardia ninae NBRC 108245 TaxID=1210091 RepID=A0A511MRV2_9NOCA|nr:hypothetical protein [Nocardia ninae]GEM43332.1 hypothetical protein NN4_78510 [Nocardia ninae NBRC 108245]